MAQNQHPISKKFCNNIEVAYFLMQIFPEIQIKICLQILTVGSTECLKGHKVSFKD